MISDSAKKATAKYQKAHYEEIKLRVPKGSKKAISDHAMQHDKSVNSFIQRAIKQAMQDDGAPPEVLAAVSGTASDSSGG